jgi:hypothetical protein
MGKGWAAPCNAEVGVVVPARTVCLVVVEKEEEERVENVAETQIDTQ